MRICGILCEYNPFHNGHAYHLAQARARSQADAVVCVMSGSFTQRGLPALADKWTRAHMALACGADVVVELPALYAVRSAEHFARGGIALLAALGAQTLCFGAEVADLDALREVACLLRQEPPAFARALRAGLDEGLSHARARAQAVQAVLPAVRGDLLTQPNCALALAYLQAIDAQGGALQPLAVPRVGAGYHDAADGPLASATAIRAAVARADMAAVAQAMPEVAFTLLAQARREGRLHAPDALDTALLASLRAAAPEDLCVLCDVVEGMEHRILRAAREAGTRDALLRRIKSKRYPHARLSRILCAALLGMRQALADAYPMPPYVRVLGFRLQAAPLLKRWQDECALPCILRAADPRLAGHPVFSLEVLATDLWALGAQQPERRAARQDYTTPPVILR